MVRHWLRIDIILRNKIKMILEFFFIVAKSRYCIDNGLTTDGFTIYYYSVAILLSYKKNIQKLEITGNGYPKESCTEKCDHKQRNNLDIKQTLI